MTGGESAERRRQHRRDELRDNLSAVRARIDRAATEAGRSADEITLIVVTKFFPESDVRLLAELGVTDVGENRHQEAQVKAAACADLGLRWHFIGSLQSKKAAAVASYADVVASVDRAKLVSGLERGAAERGIELGVLMQVSLDQPSSTRRGGVDPDEALDLAALIARAPSLRLDGVMAVAPLGEDPAEAFGRLGSLAVHVAAAHPGATAISAGMSHDLEQAVHAGATHVRIGSAILGNRPRIE